MKRRIKQCMMVALMTVAGQAHAADSEPCPAGLICASDPKGVASALQDLGYRASLGKDEDSGRPQISSAASGYNYTLYFYDCEKEAKCASLQFNISFSDDGGNTEALANKWNLNKRFLQMSVNDKKTLFASYDVTTVGGLTRKNFADVVDWWSVMLGELSKFFKENPAPSAKK